MRLSRWFAVAAALAALFTTSCIIDDSSGARGSFERALDVPVRVRIEVRSGSGDVTITRGTTGKVHVRGDVRAGGPFGDSRRVEQVTAAPPVDLSGSLLRIGPARVSNVAITYTIAAPADAIVEIHTGSGDVMVNGVEGPLDVGTGSGDIQVSDIRQSVKLSTGSGDIVARELGGLLEATTGSGDLEVERIAGNLRVRSGSGDITMRQPGGRVDARTSSGTVELREASADVRLHTSSGDCEVEGNPARNSVWEITTGSGDIELDAPDTASFALHVLGRTRRLDLDLSIVEEERSRRELRGRIGAAEARVRLETSSGSVRIR